MNKMIISVAMAALAVSGAAAAQTLPTAVTPGIVGNTVQIGVGDQRVGTPNGLIGPAGTPSTRVGVGVLTNGNTPQGSTATVTVPSPVRR